MTDNKKDMLFQVGANLDQKISINFDSVSSENLQLDETNMVTKDDVKVVLEELKQKLADMPYGSAKLLNNEPSCVIQGQEDDILNNLRIMHHAHIYSLAGKTTDDARKILNAYYQKKVSEVLLISSSLTKMKVDTKQCNYANFQKIKDILDLKLDNQKETNLIKAAINDAFSKHTCNSNFEESVAATIANTNIASVHEAYNAGKALEDAIQSAWAGVLLTNEQNNLAFDNPCYCSKSIEVNHHNDL